jgi:hypothetical protein
MEPLVSFALTAVGLLFAVAGMLGCLLPVVPGPAISFLSLIVLSYVRNWEVFSPAFLVIIGILTVVLFVVDYIMPVRGAKKYGASRWGVTGSVAGMLIGILFFPPWGLFAGAFLGALSGELAARKGGRDALRTGWGVFVGIMVSTGIKLAFTGVILFFYLKEMIVW